MYITFENPAYLWYFISIPLLIITHFLSLRSAKRKALKFANFQALKRVTGHKFVTKNIPVLILRIIVITLIILSASGMKVWYKTTQNTNNYVIAIDTSSSMKAEDLTPNRIEAAKEIAKKIIDNIKGETKIGVVRFSGVTLISQELTNNRIEAKASINEIKETEAGGTDLAGAIITSTNLLITEPEKGKAIILLTDGSNTLGAFIDNSLERAIEYAQENKVIIHTIGLGSQSAPIGYLPKFYNVSAVYNKETLTRISNSTGGIMAEAKTNQEIEEVIKKINEQTEKTYKKINGDKIAIVTAMLILFIEWGLINSRYRRIT